MRIPFQRKEGKPAAPAELPHDAVAVLDEVVARAFAKRASDVHMEPKDGHVKVRFRIDGVMVEQMVLEDDLFAQVVSRVKVLSRMDITERRIAQDGQLALPVNGKPIHMRASTFPTVHG